MSEPDNDMFPFVPVPGVFRECAVGWDKIAGELQRALAQSRTEKPILVVECYPGVDELMVLNELRSRLAPTMAIRAAEAYHSAEKIDALVAPFLRQDNPIQRANSSPSRRLSLVNFFDAEPLWRFRRTIDELKSGLVLIVGCGASLIAWGHILVHAGLTRREARRRLQRNEAGNIGAGNQSLPLALKYNRASGIDWPLADRWKRPLIKRWDYLMDANNLGEPKLAEAADVRRGLRAAAQRPFRVVPSHHQSGDGKKSNHYVDGILEENSLLLGFGELRIEVPATDLLLYQPNALLGEAVHARFGHQFPSDFGSLDIPSGASEPLGRGDGWREERISVDGRGSIELRRHWFSKTIEHDTLGGVNVLKLIEGDEVMIESPERTFDPIVVRFAETFVVPASVRRYDIRPHGPSVSAEIATLKAFVRT